MTGEQVINKSRFIGIAVPIATEEEAGQVMQKIRVDYPNARHYVYAYRLFNGFIEKSSDDGEPQGTGGRPVLDILKHHNIWNVLLAVVRYFGGILLGTGGLLRAYGGTARLIVQENYLKKVIKYQGFALHVPYDWYERLKYQLGQHNWIIKNEEFVEVIKVLVYVPGHEAEFFTSWLQDFARRQIQIEDKGIIFG